MCKQEGSDISLIKTSVLSDRELEVLRCLSQGNTVKNNSGELDCSSNTVKFHLGNIYKN
jgi:DNA-binding CsgD family transcriptional regulator